VGELSLKRQQVDSENLASLGYEPANRVLEIEFRNGRVYQYEGVPQRLVDELLQAPSKGQYFNSKIKGRYSYKRIA
jgi:KTSC domain-containing protein